jgi:hypothetical protein
MYWFLPVDLHESVVLVQQNFDVLGRLTGVCRQLTLAELHQLHPDFHTCFWMSFSAWYCDRNLLMSSLVWATLMAIFHSLLGIRGSLDCGQTLVA